MVEENNNNIEVTAQTEFLPEASDPDNQRFAFGYTITITNHGTEAAKLLSRHWIITDSNGEVQEVQGDGVIGEQPRLEPGQNFTYSSWALIPTPVGNMHGTYTMVTDHGVKFEATIRPFRLAMKAVN